MVSSRRLAAFERCQAAEAASVVYGNANHGSSLMRLDLRFFRNWKNERL
jgi:hypothetical protein